MAPRQTDVQGAAPVRRRARAMAWLATCALLACLAACSREAAEPPPMPVGRWEVSRQTAWRGTFYDITFVSESEGWAVGNTVGADASLIVHTTDAGATWQAQDSGVIEPLRRVSFRGRADGWAVGEAGLVLHTADAGETWTRVSVGSQDTHFDIHAPQGGPMWIVGDFAAAYRSDDGGATWERRSQGLRRASLRAVWFADDATGWVGTWDATRDNP